MENVFYLDTETTGLVPEKGQVIEIAGILYNIPTRSILAQASTLCYAEENPAFEINKISVDTIKKMPPQIEDLGTAFIANMMTMADAIVAHNAEFDKKWIETIPRFQQISLNKKWICTKNDVIWPIRKGASLSLINICAELGVPVIVAHRALSDCHLLCDAVATNGDVDYFLDRSGQGRVVYVAHVGYEQRQLAKEAGFVWDNLSKIWHTKMTPDQAALLPFKVTTLENFMS